MYFYTFTRIGTYEARASVHDQNGEILSQKTDLPIIVINWLTSEMLERQNDKPQDKPKKKKEVLK